MVKNFKGIVKISEIQNEFDYLVKTLNNSVDEYNNIGEIEDIDYNKAGSTLGQLGYTLTIGGLKQFMQIYDGYCFGCRVFKTATNQCKPTGGILVTKDKFYRIPTDLVNGYGTMLFYNPETNKCQIGGAAKTWKNFTQPNITSNNTFGTFSASSQSSKAYMSTKPPIKIHSNPDIYSGAFAFSGSGTRVKDGGVQRNDSLKWNFSGNMEISRISFDVYITGGFRHNFQVILRDNNDAILYNSGLVVGSLMYHGSIWATPNRLLNGLKIEIVSTNYADAPSVVSLSNLLIQGKQQVWTEEESVSSELIKIADLNWGKTSNDKLWLNDLPHSMF